MCHRGTTTKFHVVIKNSSHYADVQGKMALNDEVKMADIYRPTPLNVLESQAG